MEIADELALSYYKPVAQMQHSVLLVQHTQTKKFYVQKHLQVYHLEIYQALQAEPVSNLPRIQLLAEDETGLTVIEEYIHGDTLQELLERTGPLPEGLAVNYALQLCRIVSQLHHRTPAIIHRDIKPSNVMVTPDGVVKLLDLNAAKAAAPNEARDTTLLGTAGFAAPEQYGFAPSGVQSDLYAIGVLLNVLVTGKLPTQQPAQGELAPIVRKCIEMDPANRYASVDDLILALNRTGERESAEPAKPWRRLLPPGFRSGDLTHMAMALLGYGCIFLAGFGLQVEAVSPWLAAANRATVILIGLTIVFFTADYCGIHARLPLTKSRRPLVHLLGIFMYDGLIALVLIMALAILESFV